MKKKNIVILGGTFNPFHKGHLNILKKALELDYIDEGWIMPAGVPPHKQVDGDITSIHRLAMARIIADKYENVKVCDYEIGLTEKAYTYKTLTALREKHKNKIKNLYFMIGADSVYDFNTWKCPEKICEQAKILVALRHDLRFLLSSTSVREQAKDLAEKYNQSFEVIDTGYTDISSSELRELYSKEENYERILKNVDPDIHKYIIDHNLYKPTYTEEQIARYDADLKQILPEKRYEHSLRVAETAKELAIKYNVLESQAYVAGLLHDIAKYMTVSSMIGICHKHGVELSDYELEHPQMLHARAGACVIKEKYGINDSYILNAISYHTAGALDMTILDKIIYISDYIEPGREKAPKLTKIRRTAAKDLDAAMRMILENMVEYLSTTEDTLDKHMIQMLRHYGGELPTD